jgi:hypothetical protein
MLGGSSYMDGAASAGYTVVTDAASMLALDTETADMVSVQYRTIGAVMKMAP